MFGQTQQPVSLVDNDLDEASSRDTATPSSRASQQPSQHMPADRQQAMDSANDQDLDDAATFVRGMRAPSESMHFSDLFESYSRDSYPSSRSMQRNDHADAEHARAGHLLPQKHARSAIQTEGQVQQLALLSSPASRKGVHRDKMSGEPDDRSLKQSSSTPQAPFASPAEPLLMGPPVSTDSSNAASIKPSSNERNTVKRETPQYSSDSELSDLSAQSSEDDKAPRTPNKSKWKRMQRAARPLTRAQTVSKLASPYTPRKGNTATPESGRRTRQSAKGSAESARASPVPAAHKVKRKSSEAEPDEERTTLEPCTCQDNSDGTRMSSKLSIEALSDSCFIDRRRHGRMYGVWKVVPSGLPRVSTIFLLLSPYSADRDRGQVLDRRRRSRR